MRKIYRLKLSSEERQSLETLTRKKRIAASKVLKARALLLADESCQGKAWTDPQIIEAIGIKPTTLARLRRQCCEVGPIEALVNAGCKPVYLARRMKTGTPAHASPRTA